MSGHLPCFRIAGVGPARRLNDEVVVPVLLATGERIGLVASEEVWTQLKLNQTDATCVTRKVPDDALRPVFRKPSGRIL